MATWSEDFETDLSAWVLAPAYNRGADTSVSFDLNAGAAEVVEAYTFAEPTGWKSGMMQRVTATGGDTQFVEVVVEDIWQFHDPPDSNTDHNKRSAIYLLTHADPHGNTIESGTYVAAVFDYQTGNAGSPDPLLTAAIHIFNGSSIIYGGIEVINDPVTDEPLTLRVEVTRSTGHLVMKVNGSTILDETTAHFIAPGNFQALKMHWDTQFEFPTDPSITSPRILSATGGGDAEPDTGPTCYTDTFTRADGPIPDGTTHPWIEVTPENGVYDWDEQLAYIVDGVCMLGPADDTLPDEFFGGMWNQAFDGVVSVEVCCDYLQTWSEVPEERITGQVRLFAMANKSNNAKVECWISQSIGDLNTIRVDTYNVLADGNYGDDDFFTTVEVTEGDISPIFCAKLEVHPDGTVNTYFDEGGDGAVTLVSTGTLTTPITEGYAGFRGTWFSLTPDLDPYLGAHLIWARVCGEPVAPPEPPGPPVPLQPPPLQARALSYGCDYEVFLMDRSGTEKIRPFYSWSNITYSRVIDDVSQAILTLSPSVGNFGCCADIDGVAPWAFEVSVYRNNVREWTGPLTNIRRDKDGTVTITARDKMAWLMKRLMRETAVLDADAADVFNYIVGHAMEPDNVPGLIPNATATGFGVRREFVAEQLEKAYDVVQEISRTAIDYTMVRDQLIAGNFDIPTPPIASLTEAHIMEEPGFEYDGMQQANVWSVGGSGGGNRGFAVVGTYGAAEPIFGLLEDSVVESNIQDSPSALSNARTRWALTHEAVLVGTQFTLTPFAPVTFDTLVPGAVVNMLLSDPCLPLTGSYRINSVDVDVSVGEDGQNETVTVSVQPLGFQVLTA